MARRKKMRNGPTGMKGKEIRIVSGTYRKKSGWYDLEAGVNPNPLRKYVIVDMGGGYWVETNLWIFSIRDPHKTPKNQEEAMLQEHPDIESDLIQLCRKMAACEVHNKKAIVKLVEKELSRAVMEQCLQGNTAKWRLLEYDRSEEDEAVYDS